MKKFIVSVITVLSSLTLMSGVASASSVQIDGNLLSKDCFLDENGRTMAPVRAFAECMGCTVEWNGDAQVVSITQETKYNVYTGDKVGTEETRNYLELTIGDDKIYRNYGADIVQMDTSAKIVDGSTYVPLRFVAEALDCEVSWDGNTGITMVSTPKTRYGVNLCGRYAVPYSYSIDCSYDKQSSTVSFGIDKSRDMVKSIEELKSILGQKYGPKTVESVAYSIVNDCWNNSEVNNVTLGNKENPDLFTIYNDNESVRVVTQ